VSQDGTVYVGSDGLYAVEPTGKIKWKFETRNGIFSSPAISSDGTIYIADGGNISDKKQKEEKNKNIYAIDADGKLKWKYTTNSSAIVSSPAISKGGTVYIGGTDDHSLYAIDSGGRLKWKFNLYDEVYSSPVIEIDGTVYIADMSHYFYAIGKQLIK